MLATTEDDFFSDHRGEFDLILNTISADIPVDKYLSLLKPRGVMTVVGMPPEKQPLSFASVIGGAKVLAGSMIGGIAETQEMLDFCAKHDIAAKIETVSIDKADETYDRVVAGDVYFRAVIDTSTFAEVRSRLRLGVWKGAVPLNWWDGPLRRHSYVDCELNALRRADTATPGAGPRARRSRSESHDRLGGGWAMLLSYC